MMKLTKEQLKVAEALVLTLVDSGKATISTEIEHKVAEILVANGAATISKKKNYGHIAEIINAR